MKIFLLNPLDINPSTDTCASYRELRRYADLDRVRTHQLVDSPADAELILCPSHSGNNGVTFYDLMGSTIYKRFHEKVFVYSDEDIAMPRLPGLYAGTTRIWNRRGWTAGAHYVSDMITKFHITRTEASVQDRPLLFSFVGSPLTHPIRQNILKLSHPRSLIHDSRNNAGLDWWRDTEEARERLLSFFRNNLLDTKFILCPRGRVPSSIRLFETLEGGAVPVVISDELVLPEGPDWHAISIRIPERDIVQIPKLLEEREKDFPAMSIAARSAYENYFAPATSFNTLVNSCEKLSLKLTPSNRRIIGFQAWLHSWSNSECARIRLRMLKSSLKRKLSSRPTPVP